MTIEGEGLGNGLWLGRDYGTGGTREREGLIGKGGTREGRTRGICLYKDSCRYD